MVRLPELLLSSPLPCLHYHFLLSFHLHCHCILWLFCESHIASSIWFLNDPWLGFSFAGIYRPLPLLAPDWLTMTRCILSHWYKTDGYFYHQVRSRSNTHRHHHHPMALHTELTFSLNAPHTDFEEVLLNLKCVFRKMAFDFFQSGSVLRRMTRFLGGNTCLLDPHGSQWTGDSLLAFSH